MDIVHSTGAGCTFIFDSKGEVRRHNVACNVELVLVKLLSQTAAVSIINIVQRLLGIDNLIHPPLNFFVPIVDEVQRMDLNGLSNDLTFGGVLSMYFCAAYSSQRRRWLKEINVNENEEGKD